MAEAGCSRHSARKTLNESNRWAAPKGPWPSGTRFCLPGPILALSKKHLNRDQRKIHETFCLELTLPD